MIFNRKSADPHPAAASAAAWTHDALTESEWVVRAHELGAARLDLISLWSNGRFVYMATYDVESGRLSIGALACPHGRFPSVARLHPPALRLERTIQDLYGLKADGIPDERPWLDHGRWGVRRPCADAAALASEVDPYAFLPAEGEALHQIPVGPVHAGIIEPGHFRFSANGEIVVRLEQRLGFVHKGVDRLMRGATLSDAARLAGRVSGDSTVAYSSAFACAVEAACDVAPPPRAAALRVVMAELERLANHFGDIGAICNDAAFALVHAHTSIVREKILRAAKVCFGHRLMMDCVIPGGVAHDLAPDGVSQLRELMEWIEPLIPRLIALYGDTTSIQDRTVSTGIVEPSLAAQYAAGGFVGRASGRRFDARKNVGYGVYPDLAFDIGGSQEGDVDARVWVRFDEIRESLKLIAQILDAAPDGGVHSPFNAKSASARDGVALVEGFRGDIFAWLRLNADGSVAHCHLRDPSWFQWPLLEAAIKNNIVADFPLCNKSFNCSYSGHDL